VSMKWNGAAAKRAVRAGGADGLKAVSESIFAESQREVPVQTGALKRSGKLIIDEEHLTAEISYGEGLPDARAAIIHEKLEIHHPDGKAKYLENPTTAAAPRVGPIIAAAIRRKL
jgi:hypothetical protein